MIHRAISFLVFFIFFMSIVNVGLSGTTGKISGKVTDAKTGEALPGANIILEGTLTGAAADPKGRFVILNVQPGVYSVRASMIGFGSLTYQNIRVSIDLTTKVDFSLSEEILEAGEAVTVFAERELIQRDLTASTAVVGAEEISTLPIAEIADAIELQAGIVTKGGAIHIRGGRAGEVGYWVDGIPVTDVFDGGRVIEFNKDAVQELQVVSGAFNAEYGQAQSGIINIATKEGSNDFGGSVTVYSGDHLSTHDDIFFGIKDFNPADTRNLEASLHGPIIKDKVFYFINGRYIHRGGAVRGHRKFLPNNILGTLDANVVDNFLVNRDEDGNEIRNPDGSLQIIQLDTVFASATGPTFGANDIVDMSKSEEVFAQGKLVYKLTPTVKLAYTYIRNENDFREFSSLDNERDYILNPEGARKKFRIGNTHIAKLTQTLSNRTFYDLGFSFFDKTFEAKTFDDDLVFARDANGNLIQRVQDDVVATQIVNGNQYVHPNLQTQFSSNFKSGGTDLKRFKRETQTILGKFDITSQVTHNHQIKTGVEFRKHRVFFQDIDLRPVERSFDPFEDTPEGTIVLRDPYVDFQVFEEGSEFTDDYLHKPIEFSAYIQDKMEFESMIVNVGVRFDYFEPDAVVLADETDPNIFKPIKPENRFIDINGDGFQDPGEEDLTVADREQFWFRKVGAKKRISPRIGVAFPITDTGVFHFSYGHFIQIPNFERLYQNPEFELGAGTGNQGTIGNANLKPEFTISGEIGLQQQIGDDIATDVTVFFRDIRDLAGTNSDEITVFGGANTYNKIVNSDFGFVRGVVLSVGKRIRNGFAANADYTFQLAKATNSDPTATQRARAEGRDPEVQVTSVDWDQLHTFNATLNYSRPKWGTSLLLQYGSGLPYTPRGGADVSSLLTNSERKPTFVNVDMRAYYTLNLPGGYSANFFLRVFNLLDKLNEVNVFDDTGDGRFTTDQLRDERTNVREFVNTLDQFYTNQTHFSEPRRVEFGMTVSF